jgi:hypothetical protein
VTELPPCRCWNPARPMPHRIGHLAHQEDCPKGRALLREAKRLFDEAMSKFHR